MSSVGGSSGLAREVRSTRLVASPSTVALAREFVVATLRGWRVEPDAIDDAELVVSELVTNAFLHGHADDVAVSVADAGPVVRLVVAHREDLPEPVAPITPVAAGADEVHGRGLAIVDVLARAWGVEETTGERRVWSELEAGRSGLLAPGERADALAALVGACAVASTARGVGDAVTGWARTVLATAFAGVALPDGPDHLRYLGVEPLPADSAAAWARFPLAIDAPVAAAFRDARAYFHESRTAAVAGFPTLGPALAASHMVALAHLPLCAPGSPRPVGTLALAWEHGRELDADDREWLVDVAATTAEQLVRVGAGEGPAS